MARLFTDPTVPQPQHVHDEPVTIAGYFRAADVVPVDLSHDEVRLVMNDRDLWLASRPPDALTDRIAVSGWVTLERSGAI